VHSTFAKPVRYSFLDFELAVSIPIKNEIEDDLVVHTTDESVLLPLQYQLQYRTVHGISLPRSLHPTTGALSLFFA